MSPMMFTPSASMPLAISALSWAARMSAHAGVAMAVLG